MSYVAIPSQLKNVDSVSLELMSPDEMLNMSYGEVLTAETINYRTGTPQTNGLFCQAIFGPTRDFECACGKYKRYRYKGVICDKCGVEVTGSAVRRERMGHITLAAPCVHPWFLRIIPSRIALMLDMKAADVSRITYFSAYVITEINEEIRQEYLAKIDREAQSRVKSTKADYDAKFEELSRQYQIDKSSGNHEKESLRVKYETDKELMKTQQAEMLARIETIAEVAKKEVTSLQYKDVITEVMYQELAQKFGPVFKAGIGAEAIETLLRKINLQEEFDTLKAKMATTKGQSKKKIAKRLKLIKNFLNNDTRPEWMVLRRIMVLPPELRPMLQLDGGRFAASDLNELYRRLINRNNRLRKLIQIGAPEVILRNEKRMLQESIEALIDNSTKGGRQVMASTGIKRPLKSLTDILKGKQGRFRQNLLGKRVDYSGRSVIIVGPTLRLDQCGIPKEMALELFKPFLIGKIIEKSEKGLIDQDDAFNVHSARRLIESKKPIVFDILDEVIQDKYVLLNRAPTLHRLSFLAFKPVLTEGKAIQLHPLVCTAFNADFDGDQMAVHLPITVRGQEEAKNLMVASKNILKPASGEIIMGGKQDSVLGAYYLTLVSKEVDMKSRKFYSSKNEAMLAYHHGHISIGELVEVKMGEGREAQRISTTAGRIIFNNCFPEGYKFYNEVVNKKAFDRILNEAYYELGSEKIAEILDTIKDVSFKFVTRSGVSLAAYDIVSPTGKHELLTETREKIGKIQDLYEIGLMTNEERYKQVISTWRLTSESISKMVQEQMDYKSNVGMMIASGSRGNIAQLNQMAGIRGLSVTASGETIELPAQHGYLEGLTGLEYFIGMKGQRKALADVALRTADAGYLTRRLVDVAQNIIIMADDCGSTEGVTLRAGEIDEANRSIWERAYGRYPLHNVVLDGEVLASTNDLLDQVLIDELKSKKVQEITVRSATKCELPRGVCKKCYGMDFSNRKPAQLGIPVGIIAAQSLGEPSTQLTMRSKHFGGVAMRSDITSGLPRVEELFEARTPKYTAPVAAIAGTVEKVEGSIDEGFTITLSSHQAIHTLTFNPESDKVLLKDGAEVSDNDVVILHSTGEAVTAGYKGKIETQGNQIVIKQTNPEVEEFSSLPGFLSLVKPGDKVTKGQALAEGPLNLQDLLDLVGIDAVQEYIISQLNEIYSANGITVNEKHIEVIIRQMCSRVQVIDAGDSELTPGDLVGFSVVVAQNKKLVSEGLNPITFKRIIIGISRASLSTESFLSAASFQETAKVLVEAVISGRKDYLLGLKENVILGQLIPAGTGYSNKKVETVEVQEELEELELETEEVL
jgi:DNA-directed RNA polymerase subunit beta'